MKKVSTISVVILSIVLMFVGAYKLDKKIVEYEQSLKQDPSYSEKEYPRKYQKTIDVVITKIEKEKKYYRQFIYTRVDMTVYNEEYKINEEMWAYSTGGKQAKHFDKEKGDVIPVRIYYEKIPSTGEIVDSGILYFED